MEQLFAPWRIEWVTRDDDRESRIVARSDRAFVILNNYPYNPGHAMVVPYEHEGAYRALDDDALLDHARLKQRTFDAMDRAFDPDAYNAGINQIGRAHV